MDEPWNAPGEEVLEDVEYEVCSECKRLRPCRLLPDPFLTEVWPEEPNPPKWYCQGCHTERSDSV